MKNKGTIFYLLAVSFTILAGCSKVLDKSDLNSFSGTQVFNSLDLARAYLSRVYNENSPGWPGGDGWPPDGDFMKCTDEEAGNTRYFEGTVTVDNTIDDFGTSVSANNIWGRLRAINQFIENIDGGSLTETQKKQLKGQALFFRAWDYYTLVRLYGGVPLVLTTQNAIGQKNLEKDFLPRNKTSECIAQMADDLDSAAAYLPGTWPSTDDWGRITSGAAMALEGRILLMWASPEFNPDDQQDRWQAAYDANQNAITILKANGFGLNSSYQDMWFQEVGNPEAVWSIGFNNSSADQLQRNENWDSHNRPQYLGGGGSNQPAMGVVNAFPMINGKPITDPSSGYDSTLFYKNRDPRFYATIGYNGGAYPINGTADNKLWTYTVDGTGAEPNTPTSGFYCKKAIDPDLAQSNVQYAGTDFMEIRFAEVILNLAESACGINKVDEAYSGIEKIRARAGIEPGSDGLYGLAPSMNRAEMFKAILHERQIEFAFEGQRFWTLKRWKLFESLLNGTRRMGISISLNTSAISGVAFAAMRDTMNLDEAYEKYFTVTPKTLDNQYTINWQSNYYFFAIPQDAINNDPKLEQTKGWPGGTFDPLQ